VSTTTASDNTSTRTLLLGHSPDPDDAFMFYPMLTGKTPCEGFEFEQKLDGIETLNRLMLRGELDITAASVHAAALMGSSYKIMDSGVSMGDGYGPLIVSREPMKLKDLKNVEVAVPGILTTAYLAMRMAVGPFQFKVVPFDEIMDEVKEGKVGAGLVIHEGQLTYGSHGLQKVLDLGEWWMEKTGLPLPLGVNVIRSSLGDDAIKHLNEALRASIQFAFDHRKEALEYAAKFGRGIDPETNDKFVGMYVNDYTLSLGEKGREAITRLIDEARKKNLIPEKEGPFFA
jgi:1,4-dihydroxy-6-naphthoate synthase